MGVLSNGLRRLTAAWAHKDRGPEYPQDKEIEETAKKHQRNIRGWIDAETNKRNGEDGSCDQKARHVPSQGLIISAA